MTYELEILFGASLLYLLILFFIAYVTDSGLVPKSWTSNPFVYVLSLGVYATSWSYYGSVGFAEREGYLFLTVYLGVTFAFLFSPLLLRPILRLARDYQLTSLADLFAFPLPQPVGRRPGNPVHVNRLTALYRAPDTRHNHIVECTLT